MKDGFEPSLLVHDFAIGETGEVGGGRFKQCLPLGDYLLAHGGGDGEEVNGVVLCLPCINNLPPLRRISVLRISPYPCP